MESNNVVYILGGGPSLLLLTADEINYLNNHPNTIGINKYLMYWEMVGVIPRHMIQSDFGSPISKIVAAETLQLCKMLNKRINYYLHHKLKRFFTPPRTLFDWWKVAYRRWLFWQEYNYWIPLYFGEKHITWIDTATDDNSFTWAHLLDEPLYHYRGSLTTTINLAAILYPQADIALLGIDMNNYKAFYEVEPALLDNPRYQRYNTYQMQKQTKHHQQSRKQDIHVTAATDAGKPGIQSILPNIREILQAQGRDLYCCNPKSLLVIEGWCPYAPIMSANKEDSVT